MNFAAVAHRTSPEYIYAPSRHELIVEIFTAAKDMDYVILWFWERYETNPARIVKQKVNVSLRGKYRDCYRAHIRVQNIAAYIRYCFELHANGKTFWFGRKGFMETPPSLDGNFFEFLWPNPSDRFRAPAWSTGQIYYQIFPERFCNGDPTLSPPDTVPWGSTPTRENYMGGDLPGIIQKLDYLEQLGITCLYLTPIFEGSSNHKYDTINYYRIDPQFGTESDLSTLVQQAHRRNIRVVLDGVFNHCGYYFPPFQDVLKNGRSSSYADWFFIDDFPVQTDPVNYDCVGHYRWMPKLNLSHPETQNYFVQVGLYWIQKFSIDGWRLDVADEIPSAFWEHFSSAIKELAPDRLLLGETWGDAERLICGNRLDCAMNYIFKDAVTDWIAHRTIGISEFDYRINDMLSLYPYEVDLRMYNLLDSHDTPRFLFECQGDTRRLKLAVALQMTLPGCPAIFYGDEVGLTGDNDPLCRQAMEWDSKYQQRDLLDWYRVLIRLRKEKASLRTGEFRTAICDDQKGIYGYLRYNETENLWIILNTDAHKQEVTLSKKGCPAIWEKVLELASDVPVGKFPQMVCHSSSECSVLNLAPYSVTILQQKEKV